MKLMDHSAELRQSRIRYIDERWSELSELSREAGKVAATYLMVTNSGGAVAVLSFMGAMKSMTPFVHAPAILLAFVLGIVLVGIGRAFAYYRVARRYKRWRHAVDRFYANDWSWQQTQDHDNEMGWTSPVGDFIAWSAFACFIVGVVLGLSNF